jgi:hypothetical protein
VRSASLLRRGGCRRISIPPVVTPGENVDDPAPPRFQSTDLHEFALISAANTKALLIVHPAVTIKKPHHRVRMYMWLFIRPDLFGTRSDRMQETAEAGVQTEARLQCSSERRGVLTIEWNIAEPVLAKKHLGAQNRGRSRVHRAGDIARCVFETFEPDENERTLHEVFSQEISPKRIVRFAAYGTEDRVVIAKRRVIVPAE